MSGEYRIYMRAGDLELGVDGVTPEEAHKMFERLRAPPPPPDVAVPSKLMVAAGAEVFRRCRTDPTFARGLTDADMAREVYEAMRAARGREE